MNNSCHSLLLLQVDNIVSLTSSPVVAVLGLFVIDTCAQGEAEMQSRRVIIRSPTKADCETGVGWVSLLVVSYGRVHTD